MLVLPLDANELEQTLAFTRCANTPLLTTSEVDPRYLIAMLRELVERSERAQRPVGVYTLDTMSGLVCSVGGGRRRLLEVPMLDAIADALAAFMAEREGSEQDAVLALVLDPSSLELPMLRAAIDATASTIYADQLPIRLLVPGLQESP